MVVARVHRDPEGGSKDFLSIALIGSKDLELVFIFEKSFKKVWRGGFPGRWRTEKLLATELRTHLLETVGFSTFSRPANKGS